MYFVEGDQMAAKKIGPERLGAFSDGVIAIIITIMVLDLKVPHDASLADFLAMWPTVVAYALSYVLVGVVWVNHHHLLRYVRTAGNTILWSNLLLLFVVSLIPYFTACLPASHMNTISTAFYAGDFFLVAITFHIFQTAISKQFERDPELELLLEASNRRNSIAMLMNFSAIPVAWFNPLISLSLIGGVCALYFIPDIALCPHARARLRLQGEATAFQTTSDS